MQLINHDAGHVLKFMQMVGRFCKRLLQKHKAEAFTHVKVAALVESIPEYSPDLH